VSLRHQCRNQIRGVVKFIQLGDAVSKVEVDTDGGVLISVIRTSSLVDMGLRVGVEVIAVVKATEVALTKP
jgi:molybdopterin-binding protein